MTRGLEKKSTAGKERESVIAKKEEWEWSHGRMEADLLSAVI